MSTYLRHCAGPPCAAVSATMAAQLRAHLRLVSVSSLAPQPPPSSGTPCRGWSRIACSEPRHCPDTHSDGRWLELATGLQIQQSPEKAPTRASLLLLVGVLSEHCEISRRCYR